MLDALEDGDQNLAVSYCLSELEHVEGLPILRCPECGLDCTWPGRLEAHRMNVHAVWAEDEVWGEAA